MVYFIESAADNKSVDSAIYEMSLCISEALNQCEYDVLAENYNYVCENGAFMSLDEAGNRVIETIRKMVHFVKTKIAEFFRFIGKKLSGMVTAVKNAVSKKKKDNGGKLDPKAQEVVDKFEKQANEAKDTAKKMEDATNEKIEEVQDKAVAIAAKDPEAGVRTAKEELNKVASPSAMSPVSSYINVLANQMEVMPKFDILVSPSSYSSLHVTPDFSKITVPDKNAPTNRAQRRAAARQ